MMDTDDSVRRWRFLVGLGVHPDVARTQVESEAGGLTTSGAVVVSSGFGNPADESIVDMFARLSMLSEEQRRAVLADLLHLDDEAPTDPHALRSAIALLEVGGAATSEVLAPLLQMPAPEFQSAAAQRRRLTVGVSMLVALAVVLVGLASAREQPAPSIGVVAPATTTSVPSTTEPPPSSTTAPPPTWVDPDREVEIFLTEQQTVIRLEPWTRRVIWESRAFRNPTIVSIDPNTVTVDADGNRLILSLTDGTLLPP